MKPREWWIVDQRLGPSEIKPAAFDKPVTKDQLKFDSDIFHVIEKRHYDELKAENQKLTVYITGSKEPWIKTIHELRRCKQELLEALKFISEHTGHLQRCKSRNDLSFCDAGCEAAIKADEALEKWSDKP